MERQETKQCKRNILCELSRTYLLSHIVPVAIFTVLLAFLSFVTTSCSSEQAPTLQSISRDTKKAGKLETETTAQIAAHLSGTWNCSKDSSTCVFQTLTFSPRLESLTIENYYHFCLIQTKFDLVVQSEKDGVTYFSIHAREHGKLEGESKSLTNCEQVVENMKPWDENYSLTHSESWDQITINEMVFEKGLAQVPGAI